MAEKEIRNFALRDKDGNEMGVFTGKAPRQARSKGCKQRSYRHQASGEGNEEGACLHRRAKTGKETKGSTSMDAG